MANQIKPEIIAAITAAIQQITGKSVTVKAVEIKRNEHWALASKFRDK